MILCVDQNADGNYPSADGVLLNGAGRWLVLVDMTTTGVFKLQVKNSAGDWIDVPNSTVTSADGAYTVDLQGVYVRGNISGASGTPACTAEITPVE